MYEVDAIGLLARDLLRERSAALVAEACAWSVGTSDRLHVVRRAGRVSPTGATLGQRAEVQLPLGDENGRLDLGEARPGSLADALNALTADGRLLVDLLDEEVLVPFVHDICLLAAERARADTPGVWQELVDEIGEDDPEEVVRAAEWEPQLRADAEQLVLDALGGAPLVEVEAEGLPLSLVRAAEAELRRAAPAGGAARPVDGPAQVLDDDDLAGARFLAEAALHGSALPQPVPPGAAAELLALLTAQGIEPDEVLRLLPDLPVQADTADRVRDLLEGG